MTFSLRAHWSYKSLSHTVLQKDDWGKEYKWYSAQVGRRTFAVVFIHLLLWSLVLRSRSHYAEESLILDENMNILFTYGMTIRKKKKKACHRDVFTHHFITRCSPDCQVACLFYCWCLLRAHSLDNLASSFACIVLDYCLTDKNTYSNSHCSVISSKISYMTLKQ